MQKLLKTLLLLLSVSLLADCAHGPIVTPWVSDPLNAHAFVTTVKKKVVTLEYSASQGYSAYPPQSAQALLNYCAAHYKIGTAAPEFSVCDSEPNQGGLICHSETCQINPEQNGALCLPLGSPSFVKYADSDQYVAFSPADHVTLLAYCNISVKDSR